MAKKDNVASATKLQQQVIDTDGSILKFLRKLDSEFAASQYEIQAALSRARHLLDNKRRLEFKLAEVSARLRAMAAD